MQWRRLPFWLVVRVSISRYIAMILGDGQAARIQYKAFMCLVHGTLLDDIQEIVSLEDLEFLKAKLCRRLFKLEQDHAELSPEAQASIDPLLGTLSLQMNKIIQKTSMRVEDDWKKEKLRTTKPIPPLPARASPQDLRLGLIASRQYLLDARTRFRGTRYMRPANGVKFTIHSSKQHIHKLAQRLFALFDVENQFSLECGGPVSGETDLTRRCLNLHRILLQYIEAVNTSYDNNKEQKSLMLLLIMEIWVALDQTTCTMFPLLFDFHPMFSPRLMEVLHFSSLSDISRARKVQRYLQTREEGCQDKHFTVFDDPVKGCFAERYFNESTDAEVLADTLNDIQEAAKEGRRNKEREWLKLSSEYEALTKEIDSTACVYTSNIDNSYLPHDVHQCPKCRLTQRRKRIKIRIFESPLPESDTLAKVVVFELCCPRAFAAYRDATWAVLYRLATDNPERAIEPRLCLEDYSELQPYSEISWQLSLASSTKSCENSFTATYFVFH